MAVAKMKENKRFGRAMTMPQIANFPSSLPGDSLNQMQCLQANSLVTPNSFDPASVAAKGEPGPTSGFGRERGRRAESPALLRGNT